MSGALSRLTAQNGFKGLGSTRVQPDNLQKYDTTPLVLCRDGSPFGDRQRETNACKIWYRKRNIKSMAKIKVRADYVWLEFSEQVVEADVPILICINDMDQIGVHFNKLTNTIHLPASGRSDIVKAIQGQPFLCWNLVRQCHFTTSFRGCTDASGTQLQTGWQTFLQDQDSIKHLCTSARFSMTSRNDALHANSLHKHRAASSFAKKMMCNLTTCCTSI